MTEPDSEVQARALEAHRRVIEAWIRAEAEFRFSPDAYKDKPAAAFVAASEALREFVTAERDLYEAGRVVGAKLRQVRPQPAAVAPSRSKPAPAGPSRPKPAAAGEASPPRRKKAVARRGL